MAVGFLRTNPTSKDGDFEWLISTQEAFNKLRFKVSTPSGDTLDERVIYGKACFTLFYDVVSECKILQNCDQFIRYAIIKAGFTQTK